MTFGHRMLAEWMLDPEILYLNHGTVGATPRRVLACQQAIRDRMDRGPSQFLLREVARVFVPAPEPSSPSLVRRAASEVAVRFGCKGDDLVFVDNATTGVNAAQLRLPLNSTGTAVRSPPRGDLWGLGEGYTAEFDWVRTRDPSPWFAAAWDTELGVTEADTGTMITVPLPAGLGSTGVDAARLRNALLFDDAIEIQLHAWGGRLWVRISAQVYNERGNFERLAEAVGRHVGVYHKKRITP